MEVVMKVRKAVIPVAGFGTRLLPATKAQPKEMLAIVDKPAIQYVVEEAVAAGIEEILIINGRNKESIVNHFDKSPELEDALKSSGNTDLLELIETISTMANIHFVRQKEVKGLGYAIQCAKSFVGNEPFAVLLADDIVYTADKPCLQQLVEVFETKGCSVVGVQKVDSSQVEKYGIIAGDEIDERTYWLTDMLEKPAVDEAPSNIAILGRYIMTPEVFGHLENTNPGKGGEIQLTDALRSLMKEQDIYAYDFEGTRYDTGDKLGFLKATVEYALRHDQLKDDFKAYIKEIACTL